MWLGRTSAPVPTGRGAPGRAPSPSAPGARPRGTHQFPLLPRGAQVASLTFDALGKEGDEGPARDRGRGGIWGIVGTWGTDGRWGDRRGMDGVQGWMGKVGTQTGRARDTDGWSEQTGNGYGTGKMWDGRDGTGMSPAGTWHTAPAGVPQLPAPAAWGAPASTREGRGDTGGVWGPARAAWLPAVLTGRPGGPVAPG